MVQNSELAAMYCGFISISIANALELRLSCTNPLIWPFGIFTFFHATNNLLQSPKRQTDCMPFRICKAIVKQSTWPEWTCLLPEVHQPVNNLEIKAPSAFLNHNITMPSHERHVKSPATALFQQIIQANRKDTLKPRITGALWGNPPITDGLSQERASNAENVSMYWRLHDKLECGTWYHHPRRLQCVLSRNLRIFKVATWHYRCRHNLKINVDLWPAISKSVIHWDHLLACIT